MRVSSFLHSSLCCLVTLTRRLLNLSMFSCSPGCGHNTLYKMISPENILTFRHEMCASRSWYPKSSELNSVCIYPSTSFIILEVNHVINNDVYLLLVLWPAAFRPLPSSRLSSPAGEGEIQRKIINQKAD